MSLFTELKDGDRVSGYDFGRKFNHVVSCRLVLDHKHKDGYRILNWGAMHFGRDPMTTIVAKLARMDSPFFDSDFHVLEAQVGRGNPFCYALCHALQAVLERRQAHHDHVKVMQSCAKFGLLDPGQRFVPATCTNAKPTYAQRKRWAVNLTQHLVKNQDPAKCQLFTEWVKKDDLADAFLYAYTGIFGGRSSITLKHSLRLRWAKATQLSATPSDI